MSKISIASYMVLCTVVAACSNSDTNRSMTAPDVSPSFNATSVEKVGSGMIDGPFDIALGNAGFTQMAAAASPNAASGSRASGHVYLTLGSGFFTTIAHEQYSFVALRTDPSTPFAAKGQYNMTLTTTTGVVQEFKGNVICMGVTGNKARMAGELTSVVVNGIPRAINPNQSHNIWTVADNGEGQGMSDLVSPMIFFNAATAPLHCASDFIPPQFLNEQGNTQVR
jgi:hypothetical protein